MIAPLHAVALMAPEILDALSDEDRALLLAQPELMLRPEQRVTAGDWRSLGFLTGRGWGKTHGIAIEMHRRVRAGEAKRIALVAPTLDRVAEVQVAALTLTAPLLGDCVPFNGGVRWSNGVVAEACTAEVERPSSGSNYDFVWMTELVRWNANTRRAAFDDITTACRLGPRPQYVWDTTSRNKNDLILALLEQHERAPDMHRVVRGTMFANPILTRAYLLDEIAKYVRGTRRYDEEVLGLAFAESAGALWQQEWIDSQRVDARPVKPDVVVLGLDPALSDDPSADEVGISRVARVGKHLYAEDLSDKMTPEDYAKIVVRECARDAAGVIVERNHVGLHARDLIRVHARIEGMRVEVLPDATRAFPRRTPGVIFIREVVSSTTKDVRAAPAAALYAAGFVHHIGTLARLELEQTTWEPGSRRSPNRLDANVFAVCELGDSTRPSRESTDASVEACAALQSTVRMRPRVI